MSFPDVYADFHNSDSKGRLRLNSAGTLQDLARQGIQLSEGLILHLYSDDGDSQSRVDGLRAVGTVQYSTDEGLWVAAIDWGKVGHDSDFPKAPSPDTQPLPRDPSSSAA